VEGRLESAIGNQEPPFGARQNDWRIQGALDLQQHVKDRTQKLSKCFPKGIEYGPHYDTTRFVPAAKRDVIITLTEAPCLVVLVVFVFLQNRRTALIPTIAIPVSLIATLAVMRVMSFSLNS
jgi:multidrug efflux pump subunit AcrB